MYRVVDIRGRSVLGAKRPTEPLAARPKRSECHGSETTRDPRNYNISRSSHTLTWVFEVCIVWLGEGGDLGRGGFPNWIDPGLSLVLKLVVLKLSWLFLLFIFPSFSSCGSGRGGGVNLEK